ncbi:MAG: F0F1 ATP synthase subunit alpha, partial [Planctomycetota bacterium]
PAINVGISVSRVGGAAQIKAMKQIAGSLRLDLAAFRELEAFAQLGTELDKATQAQLDRGARMVELLKQKQYVPMDAIDQVISIFAGSKGFLDDVDIDHVNAFEQDLLKYFNEGEGKPLRDELANLKKIDGELEGKFKDAMKAFKSSRG